MNESRKELEVLRVENGRDRFYRTESGKSFTVIRLRADATGGYFETKTDEKSANWEAPADLKIISHDVKEIDHGGDYRQNVYLTGDSRLDANVWAKGHARGEANNHSWIEIEVIVTVENR
ncbi:MULTISPECIES: hypothetical protein [Bacillus]|uniref:hypothetical protein n=1 Tax=Bacillus TaxID=1386 RepID=UPI0011A240FD|nr:MULTISPECIES: hypothetical protein [Bacillus]NOL37409.1 hypothetical protein [Bacillus safensis]